MLARAVAPIGVSHPRIFRYWPMWRSRVVDNVFLKSRKKERCLGVAGVANHRRTKRNGFPDNRYHRIILDNRVIQDGGTRVIQWCQEKMLDVQGAPIRIDYSLSLVASPLELDDATFARRVLGGRATAEEM